MYTFAHRINILIGFVKKAFKSFILLLLTAIVFIGCNEESDSSIVDSQTSTMLSEVDTHHLDYSTPNISLHVTYQISSISNNSQVHNPVKRLSKGGRNSVEFVKAGKVFNACIGNLFQQESFKNRHRFVKSASWLISLGELII